MEPVGEDSDTMSLEDLKSEMFSSLHTLGAVDTIKAQFRSQFLQKLQGYSTKSKTEWSVNERLLGSLFVDYLAHYNMNQTRSVFLPESHLHNCVFSREHILEALNFDPLAFPVGNQEEMDEPLIGRLLREILNKMNKSKSSIAIQTQEFNHRLVLDEQLRRVETVYLQQTSQEQSNRTIEERMLKYQRESDEVSKRLVAQEVEQFKENTLAKMRLEERQKYQRALDGVRTQIQSDYEDQIIQLKDKEQKLEINYMKQKTQLEAELYEQRQKVVVELDKIRDREEELRRRADDGIRKQATNEARLKDTENRIKLREENIASFEDALRQKFQTELENARKSILMGLAHREEEVVKHEKRMEQEKDAMDRERSEVRKYHDMCEDLEEKLKVTVDIAQYKCFA